MASMDKVLVDTCVLLDDPEVLVRIRQGGGLPFLTITVLDELDYQKDAIKRNKQLTCLAFLVPGRSGGNSLVAQHCHQGILREGVVGVFETISALTTLAQAKWIAHCQQVPGDAPHPREYLHGVVFLFRDPPGTDALSYALRSTLVWNSKLIPAPTLRAVAAELYRVIPQSY